VKAVAPFFGTRAEAALMLYRAAASNALAVEQLAVRLRALREERDLLHRRQDAEIAERTVKLAECDAKLESAKEKAIKLNAIRDRLTLSLSSFWRRLGISIRRLFSSDAPSVNDLRDRLRGTSRAARKTEEELDKLTRKRDNQAAELRRLTIPLESVEYAISFLEQLQRSCRGQIRTCQAAIDDEIRAAVRSSSLHLLRSKLNALPVAIERRPLAVRVMRLKSLLTRLDLRVTTDEPATAELGGDPTQRLLSAVDRGFQAGVGKGSGRLSLRGEGHKHVRRTRTRPVMSSRRNHRSGLQSRTETYWDRVRVTLLGQLPVNIEIRFPQWRPEPLVQALRDEAQAWFRIGATRELTRMESDELAKTRREADEVTGEIREILESAAASGRQ